MDDWKEIAKQALHLSEDEQITFIVGIIEELASSNKQLQQQVEALKSALQKAGQLAEGERWHERFPRVFGSMIAAIKGESDE